MRMGVCDVTSKPAPVERVGAAVVRGEPTELFVAIDNDDCVEIALRWLRRNR